jgi:hypothetical protein
MNNSSVGQVLPSAGTGTVQRQSCQLNWMNQLIHSQSSYNALVTQEER